MSDNERLYALLGRLYAENQELRARLSLTPRVDAPPTLVDGQRRVQRVSPRAEVSDE